MAASPLPERAWTAWFYPDHGWTLFHLEGRDVRDWLQRQGTQDARRLDIGESLWNAFLNRKGEIECLFLMSPSESGVMAMVPPGFRQSFLDRVERYVILEDVTYRVLCDGPPVVMVVGGESAAALAEALDLPFDLIPGMAGWEAAVQPFNHASGEWLLWRFGWGGLSGFFLCHTDPQAVEQLCGLLSEAGLRPLSPDTRDALICLAGYPFPDEEGVILSETPWDLAALAENKGCFPGQEVIARLRAYGTVRRRLMALVWESADGLDELPAPGARLVTEAGDAVGRVHRHIRITPDEATDLGVPPNPVTLCWMDRSCRQPGILLSLREASGPHRDLGNARTADLPVWKLPGGERRAADMAARAREIFAADVSDSDPEPLRRMALALLLDPAQAEYYEALTVLLIRRKEFPDALRVARGWAARFPEDVMAHSNLSLILANLGYVREAEAEKELAWRLERARSAGGNMPVGKARNEEEARRIRAELEERVTLFREALEYDPEDTVALMGMGSALLSLEKPEEAAPYLRRTVEIDPWYSAAWLRLGECLLATGDRQGALQAWQEGARRARQRGDMMPAQAMEIRARQLSAEA